VRIVSLDVIQVNSLLEALVSRRPLAMEVGVDPRSVCDKLALGLDFPRLLRFCPVTIIPPMLHSYLHLHVAPIIATNDLSLRTFQKVVLFRKAANVGWKKQIFPNYALIIHQQM
jgi:hypothetical protein